MDHGIDLVQAYLRVNGCFTVTEFPVFERDAGGAFREATDVDVLALRRPEAGRVLPRPPHFQGEKVDVDARLGLQWGRTELIIAEVKEGTAEPNPGLARPGVLFEALRRFGIVDRNTLKPAVQALREHGVAELEGTRIQLLIFGSRPPDRETPWRFIPLQEVIRFLRMYLRAHWNVHGHTRFRDPALAFLALLEKTDHASP